MSFYLRIYDNYHYIEESEAYNSGKFETYDEALAQAKSIVDVFLESSWKQGITPEELLSQFKDFGDDPIIVPNSNEDGGGFSAWDYAESRVEEICKCLNENIENGYAITLSNCNTICNIKASGK